jgi:hypothetical protein
VKPASKQSGTVLNIAPSLFDSVVKALRKVHETKGTAKFLFQNSMRVLSVDINIIK